MASGGYIYFITSEPDRHVKIGWSLRNPEGRMRTLQTGCPEALRLMAFTPGSQDEERRLHQTFRELHYRGEWFYLEQKLLDLVQYLSDNYPKETNGMAPRQNFEDAIWDVVITGYDWPHRTDLEGYAESGDGSLWHFMHPEAVDA